jgi:hypothetical protein
MWICRWKSLSLLRKLDLDDKKTVSKCNLDQRGNQSSRPTLNMELTHTNSPGVEWSRCRCSTRAENESFVFCKLIKLDSFAIITSPQH